MITSTGNDIVALRAINVDRTKQSNFYSKIIVGAEKALYDNGLAAVLALEHFVWLAWSVKESVYKFLQRSRHDLIFSPSKIIISELMPPLTGLNLTKEGVDFYDQAVYRVACTYIGHKLYARSIITPDYIFSVANDRNDFSGIHWGIKNIGSDEPEDQSAAVRDIVLHKLYDMFPGDHLTVEKNLAGFPVLFKNGIESNIPLSLAHHDHYIGYSFGLPG